MKTKFLQASIGISMILLATGFFIRSIDAVHAEPSPEKFFQQQTNKIGKYMWVPVKQFDGTVGMFIWNTETGKSKAYSYDGKVDEYWKTPEKPLE